MLNVVANTKLRSTLLQNNKNEFKPEILLIEKLLIKYINLITI
jgi:predicted glycosyltransferase